MFKDHYNLSSIIINDLIQVGKLPLLLLVIVLLSSVFVVSITNKTRQLTVKFAELIVEFDSLNIECRSLFLKEKLLGNYSRVESIAVNRLQMQQIKPSQENILIHK